MKNFDSKIKSGFTDLMNLFRYAFKICNFTKQKALLEALKFQIYMSKLKRYENFENLKADKLLLSKPLQKKK